MSATDNIGPHLLGRKYVPDARDWQLAHFLSGDPLDAALAAVMSSWEGKKTKAWAKLITERVKSLGPAPTPSPTPTPTPTPVPTPTPSGGVVWANTETVLDQGQTPECVAFSWAGGWGNTLPVDDRYDDTVGHALYTEIKAIDGDNQPGSSVRSGAKAMKNRGRLNAYAFAASVDEAIAWVTTKGPLVFGTDWLANMFNVSADGFVDVSGNVAGGHAYACIGWHPSLNALEFINSWSAGWGTNGRFLMHKNDAEALHANQGDICASVELP